MKLIDLKKILISGESESVEFKEKLNDSFYKTISAFANCNGGLLLLGVTDSGNIKGVDNSNRYLEDLTNRIVDKISIYPDIKVFNMDGNRIISVHVHHSVYPASYEGRYYERIGNTTRVMSAQKLKAVLFNGTSWDVMTNDAPFNEIDFNSVRRFIDLAVGYNRLSDISKKDSVKTVLNKLELVKDEKLTNAAVLLFGKNPQKYFINLCVRIGRFKTQATIIDDKWCKGNLFQQFDEALNVIKQMISVRYVINDIQREDIWDYPIPALREIIINALIHRDYFNVGNFTVIKVYDDHIWFFNPGGLPEGITLDQLKEEHSSCARNPLISKIFYMAGFIEQYGSGTVRVIDWMKEAGLPEPDFQETMGGFSVYFNKDVFNIDDLKKKGFNERQIRAVSLVRERGEISIAELQVIYPDLNRRTLYRDFQNLVDEGILKAAGDRKGRKYMF